VISETFAEVAALLALASGAAIGFVVGVLVGRRHR
jgi:ElaB/YqjD/DUF883 family membrane-anchored ribosome-binding protein